MELFRRLLGERCEVTAGPIGRSVTAEPAEHLHAGGVVATAARGVGQDDTAGMAGEQPGVGEGDKSAEATAEHYRPGQSERVAEPPQIIGPGRQVPEFGGAVGASAITALVV